MLKRMEGWTSGLLEPLPWPRLASVADRVRVMLFSEGAKAEGLGFVEGTVTGVSRLGVVFGVCEEGESDSVPVSIRTTGRGSSAAETDSTGGCTGVECGSGRLTGSVSG